MLCVWCMWEIMAPCLSTAVTWMLQLLDEVLEVPFSPVSYHRQYHPVYGMDCYCGVFDHCLNLMYCCLLFASFVNRPDGNWHHRSRNRRSSCQFWQTSTQTDITAPVWRSAKMPPSSHWRRMTSTWSRTWRSSDAPKSTHQRVSCSFLVSITLRLLGWALGALCEAIGEAPGTQNLRIAIAEYCVYL